MVGCRAVHVRSFLLLVLWPLLFSLSFVVGTRTPPHGRCKENTMAVSRNLLSRPLKHRTRPHHVLLLVAVRSMYAGGNARCRQGLHNSEHRFPTSYVTDKNVCNANTAAVQQYSSIVKYIPILNNRVQLHTHVRQLPVLPQQASFTTTAVGLSAFVSDLCTFRYTVDSFSLPRVVFRDYCCCCKSGKGNLSMLIDVSYSSTRYHTAAAYPASGVQI